MWRRCFLFLVLLMGGCTASSDYMRELVAVRPPKPVSDRATVVFVRPSSFGNRMVVTIFDDKGRFMGDALPSTWFVRRVEAGEHTFISWAENTSALRASLLPGRVYFIEVDVKLGALSPRTHLRAVTRDADTWDDREEWIADATELAVDERGGQAYLDGRAEEVEERIRRGRDALAQYSPAELAARTLSPKDGT